MNEVVLCSATEEEARAARHREIGRLTEELTEREMELAEARAALNHFQYRYFKAVGERYVCLDELQARLAEKRKENSPREEDWVHKAARARSRADRSAKDYESWRSEPEPPPRENVPEEAKKLFRQIAALIHPDKASDESSARLRTALMAELNAAYAAGDIEGMRRILRNWQGSPEAVPGEGFEAEMERLDRTLSRLRRRLSRRERELQTLTASAMYRMMRRVEEAQARGRDLLAELAAELDKKIVLARQELAEASR